MGSNHLSKEKSTFDLEAEHETEFFVGSSFAVNVSQCHQKRCRVYVEWVDAGDYHQRDKQPSD